VIGNVLTPTMIPGNNWKVFTSSSEHALAIKNDGTLWAWGRNNAGQLGDGTQLNRLTPVQIGNGSNWKQITAGAWYTLAIKNDGTLWGWGSNSWTTINSQIPVQIGFATDWEDVASGNFFILAKKVNGTIWSWGHPANGSTGQNTQNGILVPTQIGIDSNWHSIHTSAYRSFAIKNDGTLWGAGDNWDGELGDGATEVEYQVFTLIGNQTDWLAISPGAVQTLGVKTNGDIWIWGGNSQGNLGDGTFIDNYIPHIFLSCNLNTEEQTDYGCNSISILNPISEYINVFSENLIGKKILIYDINGKLVNQIQTNQEVYLGNLQSGLYIVSFECEGILYHQKLVKR
jgi:trimeric autotransporter adhesin